MVFIIMESNKKKRDLKFFYKGNLAPYSPRKWGSFSPMNTKIVFLHNSKPNVCKRMSYFFQNSNAEKMENAMLNEAERLKELEKILKQDDYSHLKSFIAQNLFCVKEQKMLLEYGSFKMLSQYFNDYCFSPNVEKMLLKSMRYDLIKDYISKNKIWIENADLLMELYEMKITYSFRELLRAYVREKWQTAKVSILKNRKILFRSYRKKISKKLEKLWADLSE